VYKPDALARLEL